MTFRPFATPLSCAVLCALLLLGNGAAAETPTTVKVYKSPTCGCCDAWVDHLKENGFTVETENRDDMESIKAENGIPAKLRSCHTGFVGGYFVEGHVPAADLKRLLKEKPAVAGLSVPDMPIGSPGMEGPNAEAYDVLAVENGGGTRVWASHPAARREAAGAHAH